MAFIIHYLVCNRAARSAEMLFGISAITISYLTNIVPTLM